MDKKIKIGMIGAGGIAKSRHLPNLLKIKEVELFAVANRRVQNAKQVAEEYGFQVVLENWQDVVNHPEVDAVFICTPPYMHREISMKALEQGKHVFCQARMAMNLQDAGLMFEADRNTDLTTMLCPAPHYMSVSRVVQQWLKEGKIGEVRHVVVTHPGSSFLDPATKLHWRQRKDLSGINLLDVGITGEIIQRWFGPVSQLAAFGKTYVSRRPADGDGKTEVELPDSTSLAGEFCNGILFTALFSGAIKGGKNEIEIFGSKGSITCNPFNNQIELTTEAGTEIIEVAPEQQDTWTVESDFIQAVLRGEKGNPSFEEGIRYMAFTQSILDSIDQKQMITIPQF